MTINLAVVPIAIACRTRKPSGSPPAIEAIVGGAKMCLMLRDTARVASVHALPATISNPAFARPSLWERHTQFSSFPT